VLSDVEDIDVLFLLCVGAGTGARGGDVALFRFGSMVRALTLEVAVSI